VAFIVEFGGKEVAKRFVRTSRTSVVDGSDRHVDGMILMDQGIQRSENHGTEQGRRDSLTGNISEDADQFSFGRPNEIVKVSANVACGF
jgi:hypothetical protein